MEEQTTQIDYAAIAKELGLAHGKALAKDLVLKVILPVVELKVKESKTLIDDAFLPTVEAAVIKALDGL